MSEEIITDSDLIRVELRLTKSELELINAWGIKKGIDFKSTPNLIYLVLSAGLNFSPRTEKPKSERGQGRPKGSKNKPKKSKPKLKKLPKEEQLDLLK